jgi:hypothetical protein
MECGVGMELTPGEIRKALENPAYQPRLEPKTLERFDAAELASVLQAEINRCTVLGLSHVSINMNLTDCRALVRALRRSVLKGGR